MRKKPDLNEMVHLYRSGLSVTAVARKLKASFFYVNYHFRKNHVKLRTTKQTMRIRFGRAFPDIERIPKWKWHTLAYVIMTEGSIGFVTWKRSNGQGGPLLVTPYFSVSVKDRRIVRGLIDEFGEIGSILQRRDNQKFREGESSWTMWAWDVRGREALYHILPKIIPHMTAKRLQAQLLLWYCRNRLKSPNKTYVPEELLVVKWMRRLNQRGRSLRETLKTERAIARMAVRRKMFRCRWQELVVET